MLTHGIRTLFLAQSAIISLAPSQVVNRITFPAVFCESSAQGFRPPYVLLTVASVDPMMTLDGEYNESLKTATVEIECVGNTERSARLLSDSIRGFFKDYQCVIAKGVDQATAETLDASRGTLVIAGRVTGANGVKLLTFGGSFQVANPSQSQVLPVYPEVGATINGGSANAPYSVSAGSIATFVNTAALTYTATHTTTNAPSDAIHAVEWQGEIYSYDYPSDGLDSKFNAVTTTYLVQYEEGS